MNVSIIIRSDILQVPTILSPQNSSEGKSRDGLGRLTCRHAWRESQGKTSEKLPRFGYPYTWPGWKWLPIQDVLVRFQRCHFHSNPRIMILNEYSKGQVFRVVENHQLASSWLDRRYMTQLDVIYIYVYILHIHQLIYGSSERTHLLKQASANQFTAAPAGRSNKCTPGCEATSGGLPLR